MKVTIFGTGYVGLVTGACLAEVGNQVLCMDIDQSRIDKLNGGEVPIFEPGLETLVKNNMGSNRLSFVSDSRQAVDHAEILIIAVGTPSDEDGSADLSHVLSVADVIGQYMDSYKLVITKSTVPVGTSEKVRNTISSVLKTRNLVIEFDIASNPEFLKEGAAIDDFMKPDRIIIGTDGEKSEQILRSLYAPFTRNHDRLLKMSVNSAELTKYAANAMLATKISFMNEMSNLAELLDADIEDVRLGIGSDPRIGYQFIYPGAGYGGSCFPKDVKALNKIASNVGYKAKLISAVESVNNNQKRVIFNKIFKHYNGQLQGKTIALWGLAFKPKTDDMREAPSRILLEALWEAGVTVNAFDPEAMGEAQRIYGVSKQLVLTGTPEEALKGADCLVIMTEWNIFRSPDFQLIKDMLHDPVIFDGRNVYDPKYLSELGFTYYGVGRKGLPSS